MQAASAAFERNGFVHLPGFAELIPGAEAREVSFNAYWEDLALDENFKSYTTRYRRILRYWYTHPGCFELNENCLYQAKATYDVDYTKGANRLTYATPQFIADDLMQSILRKDLEILHPALKQGRSYSIDIDLFRVSARKGETSPTTSGRHQDGEDFLCMHFVGAKNVRPVISELLPDEPGGAPLLSTAMSAFLETLIVNDRSLFHAAGPVQQACPTLPAHRNLLLVSISARPQGDEP